MSDPTDSPDTEDADAKGPGTESPDTDFGLGPEPPLASRAARPFWFLLGWIAVILALAGAILPLLPTTPFLLVAAWAFGKSSRRWRRWVYSQPVFGPMLIAWERHSVIPPLGKLAAIGTMTSSFIVLCVSASVPLYVLAIIGITLACVARYILTRPSRAPAPDAPPPQPQLENAP